VTKFHQRQNNQQAGIMHRQFVEYHKLVRFALDKLQLFIMITKLRQNLKHVTGSHNYTTFIRISSVMTKLLRKNAKVAVVSPATADPPNGNSYAQ
jgi:hypothetical protein